MYFLPKPQRNYGLIFSLEFVFYFFSVFEQGFTKVPIHLSHTHIYSHFILSLSTNQLQLSIVADSFAIKNTNFHFSLLIALYIAITFDST